VSVAIGLKAELVASHTSAGLNALDRLHELVADDLLRVNALIIDRMQSPVALIPQLAGYIVASGGKRLRPLLTLAAARMVGYAGVAQHPLATAVEFIHTATLLHDDVVDESALRRGRDSANAVWGNQASVLVGDFLFSRAFELMVETGSIAVLGILSRASAIIAEGEVLQLATANDISTDEDAYLRVIIGKTAELFAAACEVGGVIADRPAEETAALRAYGLALGMAFQIVDDVLDYSAVQARLGKSIGDDFREGKLTLPVVLAITQSDAKEREFWQRTLEQLDQGEGDLDHAARLLQRHHALDGAMQRAHAFGADAKAALEVFADGPVRKCLMDVVDFCLMRDY
jgi:octaprenyl-diphosphate synthase